MQFNKIKQKRSYFCCFKIFSINKQSFYFQKKPNFLNFSNDSSVIKVPILYT